jgi:acetyl esterase/lipase
VISQALVDECRALYLGGQDPRDPLASPLHGDWRGHPPLLVQVGDGEVLHDDAARHAAVARTAGGHVDLRAYAGMPHVWAIHYPAFPEAVDAVEELGAFVARVTRADARLAA